jgi:hypothetical protein
MRLLILVGVIGALSGCAWRDEIIADRIAGKAATCEKMGYTPDTDAFRNCQVQLYQADEAGGAAMGAFIRPPAR